MIKLDTESFDKIVDHARRALPNEACGLVAGIISGDERTVVEVYLLRNVDESPEHFSMDPKEQLSAIKDSRVRGLTLLGNFHSHPATPSRPSDEDIRLAFDPSASYLIVSLQKKSSPVLNSFRVKEGKAQKEEIILV